MYIYPFNVKILKWLPFSGDLQTRVTSAMAHNGNYSWYFFWTITDDKLLFKIQRFCINPLKQIVCHNFLSLPLIIAFNLAFVLICFKHEWWSAHLTHLLKKILHLWSVCFYSNYTVVYQEQHPAGRQLYMSYFYFIMLLIKHKLKNKISSVSSR